MLQRSNKKIKETEDKLVYADIIMEDTTTMGLDSKSYKDKLLEVGDREIPGDKGEEDLAFVTAARTKQDLMKMSVEVPFTDEALRTWCKQVEKLPRCQTNGEESPFQGP